MTQPRNGFTLVELLVTVAIAGLIGSLAIGAGRGPLDRLELDAAARRLQLGLERARLWARRQQQACGISLTAEAWLPAESQALSAALTACGGAALALQEQWSSGSIRLHTNLPAVVRVSANGLLLDGGTTVLSHARLPQARCLVVSLPLGVSRLGDYQGDLPSGVSSPRSDRCLPTSAER